MFRDSNKASDAADAMKVTSRDLFDLGIVDVIVNEPNGAAHIDPISSSEELKKNIILEYEKIRNNSIDELISNRLKKYDNMGEWSC